MIKRNLQAELEKRATFYPVIALLGPRQSGKATLAQVTFPHHHYVSLESFSVRKFAQEDPQGFLQTYENAQGVILDEFQHVPELLSFIQTKVDADKKKGYFILTGSQNFLMNAAISQSLAGRISILTLLPLSISELTNATLLPVTATELLLQGFYPPIYANKVPPAIWYPDYTQTYLERDIRQLTKVGDLTTFQTFMQLCAGRCGQLLNLSALAADCGISDVTAKRWLSLLEASYIIFLLRPHHNNFGKRLTKSPKLYFYDVGLACSLIKIPYEQLATHHLRGNLFESMILADFMKQYYNAGQRPSLYFWRDHVGNEIDALIEHGTQLIPIEIKAGQTVTSNYLQGLTYYNELAGNEAAKGYVVYGGDEEQKRSNGTVMSWRNAYQIVPNT